MFALHCFLLTFQHRKSKPISGTSCSSWSRRVICLILILSLCTFNFMYSLSYISVLSDATILCILCFLVPFDSRLVFFFNYAVNNGYGIEFKTKIKLWLFGCVLIFTNLLVSFYVFLFIRFFLIIRDIFLGTNVLDYKSSLYYDPGLTCIARIACIYG